MSYPNVLDRTKREELLRDERGALTTNAENRAARLRLLRGGLGIALYLGLVLAPLVLMLFIGAPSGREIWRELSVSLGFGGLSILMLQFAVSARLRRLKAPYGVDVVYHFHRQITFVALGLVSLHPVLLFIFEPATLGLLNVFTAPLRARMAVLAVVILLCIMATALWRQRFSLSYERWRLVHDILAVALVVVAVTHVELVGHYVSVPWKRWLWIAYGAMTVSLVLWVRLGKPLLKQRRPYQVTDVRAEGPQVWCLAFAPVGHRGIGFNPGQFAWITLDRSPFSLEEHPFSFSSSALARGSFEVTVKELGDFTSRIGDTKPGTIAYVDGPFGAFDPDRYPAAGHVFIAGGIGITPFMSILRTAAGKGDPTPTTLFCGAPSLEQLVFADELTTLRERLPLRFVPVLEEPPSDWVGERGFVTREILERHVENPRTQEFFLCGPPPMIGGVTAILDEIGVPTRRLHYERFDFV